MTKDMTQGSPLKLILAFAVPLMLGSLFQQFYNLADTIIVGRFVGVDALAAVGSVGGLNYLVLGFVNGIACGFSIPISWTFGAKDYREMRRYTANTVWLSLFFAVVLTVVRPGKVDPKTLRVPVAFFFAAAAIYCVAAYGMGRFTRPMGLLMLGMFVAYMAANVWQMKNAPAEPEHEEEPMGIGKIVLLLVVGAALIALGANLLVDNGTIIAQAMGVPESVIALTFVALGTSLPELVTAITSLMKGHSDLSLGNVVGANVFNLVLVSGLSVTLAPFEIPQSATLFGINSSLVLELPVMLLVMALLTIPALVRGKLSRVQGVALLCIYAAFCAVQFTM